MRIHGSTLVTDTVDYAVLAGEILRRFLAEPEIRRIFSCRQEVLRKIFGGKEYCASDLRTPCPTRD